MCLGGSASAPEVRYVGPSKDDIRRNEKALETYQQQIADQQSEFQKSLQDQIDAANAETDALRSEFAAETANAASAANAEVYAVTAAETEIPDSAQTTTSAVKEKKTPKKSLKISTAGTLNSAGSGLNIGV